MSRYKHAIWFGVLVLIVLIPYLITNPYFLHILIMTLIWVTLATNFNIILSAGQLSLAQIAFFGIGAYTSGLLAVKAGFPFVVAMLAAALLTCGIGFLIGRITLKMRGSHFVLVTFAFGEMCRLVARNWVDLTNGPMGLRDIPFPSIRIPGVLDLEFASYQSQFYVATLIAAASVFVAFRLRHSLIGRALSALRISEPLAESVGIGHYHHVIIALLVSTFFSGLAGSFYAHYVTLVSPEVFSFAYMISLLMMVIGGGRNSVAGPVLGAFIFTLLPEFLRAFEVYRMMIFGALLTIIIIFLPQGIVPMLAQLYRRLFDRLTPTKDPSR